MFVNVKVTIFINLKVEDFHTLRIRPLICCVFTLLINDLCFKVLKTMFSWIFFFIFILLEHWSGSVNIHVHHFWYFYPYTNELLSSDFFANVFLHNIYCKLKYYFLRTNSYKLYCIMTSESYGNWIGLRNCPLGDWRYAGSLSRDLVAMLLSRLKVLDNSY